MLRILKNEVYTGTMVQGRRQKINYKIKKIRDVEESGWIRVPNMHEAIIPQKLFDTVQDDDIIKELSELDISNMTPMDALNTLYRFQGKVKNLWK